MFEKEMTISQFKELSVAEKENHVFAFLSPSGCSLCQIYEKHFERNPIPHTVKVTGTEEELMAAGIIAVPLTLMFKGGEVAFRSPGVLFDKQKKAVLSEFQRLFGGKNGN